MAQSIRKQSAKPDEPVAFPLDAWSTALAESCLQLQCEALNAWQQSFAIFNKDFWEQWACRYAGGVPIDA